MLRLSRSATALVVGAALLSAMHGWVRVAESAGISAPPAVQRLLLRDVLHRRTALYADLDAARERNRRAEELAVAVVEGRLTLQEAAGALGRMFQEAPDYPWITVERRYPGASDEERCCRLLIGRIRALEGPRRERAQAVASRLEAQLDNDLTHVPARPLAGARPTDLSV
jgi:hypothetical protein